MTSKLLTNPQYWRDRAEEIKAIADRLANQEAKRTMLDIAICYEQLAQRAEERLSASGPG
jgi:3-methyladenine DNA glycosylase/8-oxoguanine DNA glycosylase